MWHNHPKRCHLGILLAISKGVIIKYNKISTPAIIFLILENWTIKSFHFEFKKLAFSGRYTLFGVRVITNQALPQHTMISHEDIKNSSLHKRFEILQLNHL